MLCLQIPTPCPSPSSFVKVPGSYNYAQAQQACATYGYTLPLIKNSTQQTRLQECMTPSNPTVWLGLTDAAREGSYRWDDSTTLTARSYNSWSPGEPVRADVLE
jgi:hypothetical protein